MVLLSQRTLNHQWKWETWDRRFVSFINMGSFLFTKPFFSYKDPPKLFLTSVLYLFELTHRPHLQSLLCNVCKIVKFLFKYLTSLSLKCEESIACPCTVPIRLYLKRQAYKHHDVWEDHYPKFESADWPVGNLPIGWPISGHFVLPFCSR